MTNNSDTNISILENGWGTTQLLKIKVLLKDTSYKQGT